MEYLSVSYHFSYRRVLGIDVPHSMAFAPPRVAFLKQTSFCRHALVLFC